MFLFWVFAALLGGTLSTLVLFGAARASASHAMGDSESEIYRRQLAEIDDLVKRGLLESAELGGARAEAGRRLMASTKRQARMQASVDRRRGWWVFASAAVAPLAALALYVALGAPGLPDQPFEARISAWRRADPEKLGPAEMAAVLEQVARERPENVQAQLYLARAQALSGQEAEALRSLRRAAELEPRRAEVWSLAGQIQAEGTEGPLPSSARMAFERALALDPRNVAARYFVGRDLIMQGDRAGGLRLWRSLLSDLPVGQAQREALRREIGMAERGVDPPTAAPEADPAEVEMIEAMVARLAGRLRARPDDPQGWARLIHAYGVLGWKREREQALTRARLLFRSRPQALRQIDAALTDSSIPQAG